MSNKYDKYQSFTLPFAEMAAASGIKSKALSNIQGIEDNVQNSFLNINALGNYQNANGEYVNDTDIKNQYIQEQQAKIDQIHQKYKNDPLKAIPEIQRLGDKIKKDLSGNHPISSVQARYNGYQSDVGLAQDYKKKYIESAGKEGVDPTEGAQSLQYNLMHLSPITQQPLGDYNGYVNTTFSPTLKHYKEEVANDIGKDLQSHPDKYATTLGLNFKDYGAQGLYWYGKDKKEIKYADVIARAVKNRFNTDPLIQDYNHHINTIFGNYDKAKQAMNALDNDYLNSYSPNYKAQVADEILNSDDNKLAQAIGEQYRVNNSDPNIHYGNTPGWEESNKRKLDNNLTTYNGPAVNIPGLGIQAVELNQDGSLKSTDPGFINTIKNNYAKIGSPGFNVFDFIKGSADAVETESGGVIKTFKILSGVLEATGLTNDQPSNPGNTELQKQLETNATNLRMKFPDLNKSFPYKANKTKDGIVFDQNAGLLINFAANNLSNNTVVTKYMKPDNPEKFNKDLFSFGGFNDLVYKGGNGESLTKNDYLATLGYEDGKVPQKTIEATKISSIGTFLEPGYIHGTMPDADGNAAQISIEPSSKTKDAFQNTNYASEAYKTFSEILNKPIHDNNGKWYIADYIPTYSNGKFGVKIETYEANPDGTKGTFYGEHDAFDVYEAELKGWAKSNNITIDKK